MHPWPSETKVLLRRLVLIDSLVKRDRKAKTPVGIA
jgi:hypothetical protein